MLIIGASGHAKEVIELFSKEDRGNLVFFDNINFNNQEEPLFLDRFKIINSLDKAKDYFNKIDSNFLPAIGSTKSKEKIIKTLISLGGKLNSIIAKDSLIGSYDTNIGLGSNVMNNVLISNSVTIGQAALINYNSSIHHDVIIGDFCEISPKATVLGHCKIGNYVSIGSGATILPHTTIEDYATIGAGAVVTKNVKEKTTVIGIPAKPLK